MRRVLLTVKVTRVALAAVLAAGAAGVVSYQVNVRAQTPPFHLQEATIDDVQRAIQSGQITCRGLVQAYVNRAKAYDGVSNKLLTADGSSIPPPTGTVRAGSPLKFPVDTTKASTVFPDLDQYAGPPIEFGRMESTASDPTVQQQYGMIVGIPNAGQLNALGTLNLRGERSVTCKGDFDKAPGAGPLPAGAPRVCEVFRKLPDALERAAELDAQYGRNPDLTAMPMYCIPFAFKDSYDTKDMRSTAGGDARYDIDFPARDQTAVAALRSKGAIIYAKSVPDEYNARAGNPGGPHKPSTVMPSTLGYQRSAWSGNPSNPYDTTRASAIGSSSGSGVAVSANLVMCALCEETHASCRGPANHNSVVSILPAKGSVPFLGGSIGNDIYNDTAGINCRTLKDAAKVLDAFKDPKEGFYDPRDIFTTVYRSSALNQQSYAAVVDQTGSPGSLKGVRIGVVRESMLTFPGVKADEPIVEAAIAEIKNVIGRKLGATLVESVDPHAPDDPEIENMKPSYTEALAKLLPILYPDLLYRLTQDGRPQYPEFAAKITPTEFAPGKKFGTGTMKPIEYLFNLAEGREPVPAELSIRSILNLSTSKTFRIHFEQYATRRAADWAALGFLETLVDFPTLNARSKFWGNAQKEAFKNWEDVEDIRNPLGERQGIDERIQLRELLQRVEMKVVRDNHLDLIVRLHTPLPPGKIGMASAQNGLGGESAFGPNAGLVEVLIPAGFVRTVYDPYFVLSPDKKRYVATNNNTPTMLPAPGLPFSLTFRAEPGKEDVILKVAAAYEAASKRRIPPSAFKPVAGEP